MSATLSNPHQNLWSNLPNMALALIADHLGIWLGHLRLMSICSSWRSSLSSFSKPIPFPLILPFPISPLTQTLTLIPLPSGHYTLNHHTLFHLYPPGNPNSPGILVTLIFTGDNDLSILKRKSRGSNELDVKSINLLDYGISPVVEFYSMDFVNSEAPLIHKCFGKFMSVSVWKVAAGSSLFYKGEFGAVALTRKRKLGFWKLRQDCWTKIDDCGLRFDDVVFCHGKFYAVDCDGNFAIIDLRLNAVEIGPGFKRRRI